jgi:hypothetical protein
MLKEEFEYLQEATKHIEEGIDDLYGTLHQLLDMKDKSFTITFKGKIYDFHPATTEDEEVKMYILAKMFIERLLIHVISKNVKTINKEPGTRYGWDDILSFASGPDPKYYQYEKISVDQLYEVSDESGEKITSLPLNQDSSYVKAQDERNG